MKKVFSSNAELAHFWANQLQHEGRGNSMFFEGPVIYSYGYHYEIARFIEAPNGQRVVFVNSNGYSNSTAKHTNHVHHAIPDGVPVYRVPFYRNHLTVEALPGLIEAVSVEIKNLCYDQTKARTNYGLFYQASEKYTNLVEIAELFGLQAPVRPENWEPARLRAEHLRATVLDRELAKKEKAKAKNQELLTKWLQHEYNGQLYDVPVHLRISKDGQLIETTKGARVGLSEALRLLSKLRNREDVKGETINGFTVIENTESAVKIGCHVISWPIINQFFNQ